MLRQVKQQLRHDAKQPRNQLAHVPHWTRSSQIQPLRDWKTTAGSSLGLLPRRQALETPPFFYPRLPLPALLPPNTHTHTNTNPPFLGPSHLCSSVSSLLCPLTGELLRQCSTHLRLCDSRRRAHGPFPYLWINLNMSEGKKWVQTEHAQRKKINRQGWGLVGWWHLSFYGINEYPCSFSTLFQARSMGFSPEGPF